MSVQRDVGGESTYSSADDENFHAWGWLCQLVIFILF